MKGRLKRELKGRFQTCEASMVKPIENELLPERRARLLITDDYILQSSEQGKLN